MEELEQKIELAARTAAGFERKDPNNEDERYYNNHNCVKYDFWKAGAQFVQNEMLPLFIEFHDFCMEFELYGKRYTPVKKTTEQLFQLWMQEKSK